MSERVDLFVLFEDFINLLVETLSHFLNERSLIDQLLGETWVFQLVQPDLVFLVDLDMDTEVIG